MSSKYKFRDQEAFYFVSFATVDWIDLFTRDEYRLIITASLSYCQQHKGLILCAWCIMPNHVHLIIGTQGVPIQDIMRDLKSYTSRALRKEISNNPTESRRSWLLAAFTCKGLNNKSNNDWQLWQKGSHPVQLCDNTMIDQRLAYLHNNPVKGGWISRPEDYVWSSARDYSGVRGILDIYFID
jgi:putative transposase